MITDGLLDGEVSMRGSIHISNGRLAYGYSNYGKELRNL
jgi:hypothetical protein